MQTQIGIDSEVHVPLESLTCWCQYWALNVKNEESISGLVTCCGLVQLSLNCKFTIRIRSLECPMMSDDSSVTILEGVVQ